MPRPPAKKKTTAHPAQAARHHSTTSIKSGQTFNGRVEDDGSIVETGDELPIPTKPNGRISRAASKRLQADAHLEKLERNANVGTDGAGTSRAAKTEDQTATKGQAAMAEDGEGRAMHETLVAATPDQSQNNAGTRTTRSVTPIEAEPTNETGRRSKRVKDKATNLVRRVSTSGKEVLRKLSPPGLDHQVRISSSPPVQQVAASASAARVAGTPSFLRNFKKQPRQPSILHMVQQDIAGFDDEEDFTIEDDTDLLGHITVASVPQPQPGAPQDDEGLYDEADALPAMSSSSRKRKASELEPEEAHVTRSSARNSPFHDIDLPSDPANLPQATIEDGGEADDLTPDDSASVRPPRSSPPIEEDQRSERLPSPRKSKRPPRPGRTIRTRKSARSLRVVEPKSSSSVIDASSPHSTPPSSPVNTQAPIGKGKTAANTRKSAKRETVVAITTAALQALLPKRKVVKVARQHDTFDIHSSSTSELAEDIDEDEDELSRPHRRRAPVLAVARSKPGALKSPTKVTKSKAQSKAARKTAAARRGKSPAKTATAKGATRTYGRKSQGEQENEDGAIDAAEDGEDVTPIDVDASASSGPGGDLKDAKNKFAQIDEWELEFESADVGGGDSSPWR
jgi:hypothetical protein